MQVGGLYVIIDTGTGNPGAWVALCQQVLEGGAQLIQFRNKGVVTAETYVVAKELRRLCGRFSVPFLVNDHVDLVLDLGADGAHIGQDDLSMAQARKQLGAQRIIGVSASNAMEAREAEACGADYIGCGHVYPTQTKQKQTAPIGLEGLQNVVNSVRIPVMGIGGITLGNTESVLSTGAAGVVLVSALASTDDPRAACQEFRALMNS